MAPFHLYLISIGDKGKEIAGRVYEELWQEGMEVLYDDREDSPGIKFKDADLIGLPLRMTISDRSLQKGGAEMKLRKEKDSTIIPLENIKTTVMELKTRLEDEIKKKAAEKASRLED